MRLSRHLVFSCRINAASVFLHPRDFDTGDPASVFPAGRSPEGVWVLSLYRASHCSIKMHVAHVTVYVSADETLMPKDVASGEPTVFTRLFFFLHAGFNSELSMASCDFLVLIRFNQGSGLLPSPLQFPAGYLGISQIKSVNLKLKRWIVLFYSTVVTFN